MNNSLLHYLVAPHHSPPREDTHLLVFLHGRGTDESDLIGLSSVVDSKFTCVSVRAPYRFPFGGYTWFDLDELGNFDIDQVLESEQILFDTLDELQKKYSKDTTKISLFGFSMGAMMALLVSLQHPSWFHSVVAHSGLLPIHTRIHYDTAGLASLQIFLAHGIEDPVVPIRFGREARDYLQTTSVQLTYHEYPIQHTISDQSLQDITQWLQTRIKNHI